MRLEYNQIIDRLPESDCKDLCTNFRGCKSLHDHSLKTVKICVHCTQIFTLCKDLHCKDLRPPTVLDNRLYTMHKHLRCHKIKNPKLLKPVHYPAPTVRRPKRASVRLFRR